MTDHALSLTDALEQARRQFRAHCRQLLRTAYAEADALSTAIGTISVDEAWTAWVQHTMADLAWFGPKEGELTMTMADRLEQAATGLKELAVRASAAAETVQAAKAKGKAALQVRADEARATAQQAADSLKAQVTELRVSWQAHVAQIRTELADTKDQFMADWSNRRVDRAEAHALAAVEFAQAALDEAAYQVLNAAVLRLDAKLPPRPVGPPTGPA